MSSSPLNLAPHVIRTFTGKLIDLAKPSPSDINIRDIARALSQINRFTGHTRRPYTVAEHSVHCSYVGDPEYALHRLLHDAHEAYLGDVASPLKSMLQPRFGELAADFDLQIGMRFGLQLYPMIGDVKEVDALALRAEFDVLMLEGFTTKGDESDADWIVIEKLRADVMDLWRNVAGKWEKEFLARFYQLMNERALQRIADGIGDAR